MPLHRGTGKASTELEGRIREFIEGVRSLIKENSNLSDLREDLEFGYGALFVFQARAALGVDGLSEQVDLFEAAGDIDNITIGELRAVLYEIEDVLSQTDFDAAPLETASR